MRQFATLLSVGTLLLAGCSNADNSAVVPHPVTGKIIYDGKAAAGVEVTLLPTDAPMVPRIPRNPHAVTGADGGFSISTFADGDGAGEGGYQIVLTWPVPKDEKLDSEADEATERDRLYGWYDGTHSTLQVRVKAGSNEIPTITIPRRTQPPPVSQGVPGRN